LWRAEGKAVVGSRCCGFVGLFSLQEHVSLCRRTTRTTRTTLVALE